MATQFPEVKAILDRIIADWSAGNHGPPDLLGNHGDTFRWDTREALMAASARGIQLIQSGLVRAPNAGHQANLVLALTGGVGVNPPMPDGGLDSKNGVFLTLDSPEIQTIISWIEGGCLP